MVQVASGGMVVVVVDSLLVESIPSSIVAIAGVSYYDDSFPLRFFNTRTLLNGCRCRRLASIRIDLVQYRRYRRCLLLR
ncbi:hypothetical protein DEO72_LG10g578 [Vigna unguiculata]|uniref:Uncharacterized protein n=1 Tax=Vigna unguiculata TaxID=3917 RepID=A0A4D6NA29_VIGUN|nr:hypothetical protein DEO72_LG10g578 [Vigna unguiculata]